VPFIEEHSRNRAELAHETSSFLESQLAEARTRLVAQEKRLEAYRLRHGTELPTQFQSNMQAVQSLQAQLQAAADAISRTSDRRLLVARQLADLESEQFLPDPGAPGAPTVGADATVEAKSPTVAQYDAAVTELRGLELRLTARHPDLARGRKLVADLQQKVEQEKAAAAESTARRPPTPAEVLKHNRIKELEAELESLDRQIADRHDTEDKLRADIQSYQTRVEALPTRESELAALTRDYDTLQNTYRTLLSKREDSKISENLEQQQVGGQFRIIDPPHRPQTPLGPNRRTIAFGGAMAGAMLGVVLALVLQWLDKSLMNAADVDVALGLPVVATIPLLASDTERRLTRRRRLQLSIALTVLLVALATAVWLGVRS
jgi:protein tyrosine kinase modulator